MHFFNASVETFFVQVSSDPLFFIIVYESSVSQVQLVEADVSDHESLVKMCKTAKVVLNCVGPVSCSFAVTHSILIEEQSK